MGNVLNSYNIRIQLILHPFDLNLSQVDLTIQIKNTRILVFERSLKARKRGANGYKNTNKIAYMLSFSAK